MTRWIDMAINNSGPLAFLSYAHFNNIADNGAISAFSNDLSNEVKVQTGKDFPIFQDRNDTKWGQNWRARIDKALTSATFFIPIVTPSYFTSDYCISELNAFLRYEKQMGRHDLILPLVYVFPKCGDGDEADVFDHPLAEELFRRNYADWTKLRFYTNKSMKRKRRLSDLALEIKSAIIRTTSYQSNRDSNELFFVPKRFATGNEDASFDSILGLVDDDDPRSLLQRAQISKAQGRYEEAKSLHDKLVALAIDWDRYGDFFVDLVYFSVSLLDKLEEWQELDCLERQLFNPVFAKLREVVSAKAFSAMLAMHEASMALSLLRQMRTKEAFRRIQSAVADPPELDDDPSYNLLYANALVTRALVQHAKYIYGEGSSELLLTARSDLVAAERIYRKYAKMGKPEEFHHLGRFYGARAFVQVAELRAKKESLSSVAVPLLEDGRRAHEGASRRGYGRIAGKYCHAYCLFELAADEMKEDVRIEQLAKGYRLLRDALSAFDRPVLLGRCKVAGLSELVLQSLADCNQAKELDEVRSERMMATARLRVKGFQLLAKIGQPEWLRTPLN
jgi:tetratricopeptide (TPR) repeat protein